MLDTPQKRSGALGIPGLPNVPFPKGEVDSGDRMILTWYYPSARPFIARIIREPIKVLADILSSKFGLSPGQIMLSFEEWNIPKTRGLYFALSYISEKVIANNNYTGADVNGGFTETQQVVVQHDIQIDVMSFDDSARLQKEQVIVALRSVAAQQGMEENNIRIARIPSGLSNTSSLEESKIMNRYSITVRLTALHTFRNAPPYYNTFQTPEVHHA